MYTDFLMQAREASDKISQGTYDDPRVEEPTGVISRPEAPVESGTSPYEDMILRYMATARRTAPPPLPRENSLGPTSAPIDDEEKALYALSMVETGTYRKGDDDSAQYSARGPKITNPKSRYFGEKAMGKYQVMPGNVPQWTKQALGTELTPEEFLASPKAQDAVALDQMRRSKEKHGSWDEGASVWFSGRTMKKAGNASDGYATVPEYLQRFRKYYNGGS
jgi:hypothetical protein